MLTHRLHQGVLVVSFTAQITIADRAAAALYLEHAITTHPGFDVMVEIPVDGVTPVVVSLVLRGHRLCEATGVRLGVITQAPEARRVMTAHAGKSGPVVFGCLADVVDPASEVHDLLIG